MKYSIEITLNRSLKEVWAAFDNIDNMKKWQPSLVSFEPVSGTPGQPGAVSKLVYVEDGRRIEMIETITHRAEPNEFDGTYDAAGVHNINKNRFYEAGPNQTRWVQETEFQFKGLMAIMSLFMGGSFRKTTRGYMENFKAMLEGTRA